MRDGAKCFFPILSHTLTQWCYGQNLAILSCVGSFDMDTGQPLVTSNVMSNHLSYHHKAYYTYIEMYIQMYNVMCHMDT